MTIIALDLVRGRISTLPGRPGDGAPPDALPVLTSLIYPLEVIESIDAATDVERGWMQDPVDHLDVETDLVSGVLTATIEYESAPPVEEGLDVVTDIEDAVLTVVIEYESAPPVEEGLDVSTAVAGGALTTVINYVTHTDPATDEGIDVASYLVAGSLT